MGDTCRTGPKQETTMTERRHRADFDPPGAKGPLIWYLVKGVPLEIRMTENLIDDCFAAAESLKARFFIMRHRIGLGLPDGWGVFDMECRNPENEHIPLALQNGKKARPVRVFDTETLDAPVMWAIMRGGVK